MKNYILVDTHAHINCIVQAQFDEILTDENIQACKQIINEAFHEHVGIFINVGTSLTESMNSITLAHAYENIYAVVGIHPNDCTENWYDDFKKIAVLAKDAQKNKIVGIGECGIDRHYPHYNLQRQYDAFRAHIELAITHNLALVIHSRDAYDETLKIMDEYKHEFPRSVMHCFSYDAAFADYCIARNLYLGIGGTVTYPKNTVLREIVRTMPLKNLVLETDAPFLPPQQFRGQKNNPKHIATIAEYIAHMRHVSIETIARSTTQNAFHLFGLSAHKHTEQLP